VRSINDKNDRESEKLRNMGGGSIGDPWGVYSEIHAPVVETHHAFHKGKAVPLCSITVERQNGILTTQDRV